MIYNGIPTEDATITVNLVNQYLNDGIAAAAIAAYEKEYAIDRVGSVPDGFYMTFSGMAITKDEETSYNHFTLPQIPVGLSKENSVSDVFVIKPSGAKIFCTRVEQREIPLMFMMPLDTSEAYYWIEGKEAYVWAKGDISDGKPRVRMVYSQSTDLNSEINCPGDMIPEVISYTIKMLMAEKNQPMNTSNEGIDTPNIKQ